MFRSHHRRTLLLTLASAAAFTTISSADHSWSNYHWARQGGELRLDVGDNVSQAWDAYLDEAIRDWNPSTVIELTEVAGGTKKNCRPTSGRIEACSGAYGNTGWLGIAQIWVQGSHITQAITKLNDTYFNTATYNTPAWRRLVTCQEIAHDFGLDHQDENFDNPNLGSCMDYTSDPAGPPSNEHPNSHDFAQLVEIYSHGDQTVTASAAQPQDAPPAINEIDFDTPAQWGRLVRASANRRVQVYELDFGRGHKVITHVFWADPEGDARGRGR